MKLQELNSSLAEKIQTQQEEFIKSQAQLQDARDQADLLEFRVLELEEENEKVSVLLTFNLNSTLGYVRLVVEFHTLGIKISMSLLNGLQGNCFVL